MSAATLRVRRATVEDLGTLRPMWTSMHLTATDLEPRITEFQIVETAEGSPMGGIGLRLAEKHGQIHSEAFTDFSIADKARELIWSRIQTLASNHGIFRLWMRETNPFWTGLGFKPADAETLKRLPPVWNVEGAKWFTFQLKDEAAIASLEKELAMFMEAEKQNSARVFERARVMKTLVTVVAFVIAALVFGAAIYVLMRRPDMLHSGR